jgi:GNAT superfamily N-acetyltransferase
MSIKVTEEPMAALDAYACIPISYEVHEVLELAPYDRGLGGLLLSPRRLENPYIKDYDALAGEGPTGWAQRFDVSNWGCLVARLGGRLVGGAVVAFNTPGVWMLEGRMDLAVLWDLRVEPESRRRGVGAALFGAVEGWAVTRGCRQLKVETQTVNVPACRFYARQGCLLGAINRHAYPDLPGEVQLLWYKDLASARNR